MKLTSYLIQIHEDVVLYCEVQFSSSVEYLYWQQDYRNLTVNNNARYSGGTIDISSLTIHMMIQDIILVMQWVSLEQVPVFLSTWLLLVTVQVSLSSFRIMCVFSFVLCTLCCQFLWIVHFVLPLRYSATAMLQMTVRWYIPVSK